jgi:hypothetical protein
MGRKIGREGAGMDRTLDRVTNLGEYTPKSTIPVVDIDAVPSGAIGGADRRSAHARRLGGEDAGLWSTGRLCLMIEERVELGQLKLDDGDGGVDLGLSVVEGLVEAHRRRLKSSNTLLALLSR